MRPEISEIMRFLYPNLSDAENVKKYPEVRGMRESVYFFDHNQQENSDEGTLSKMNKFEAEMIINFSECLIKQLYKPDQITILSLYMA